MYQKTYIFNLVLVGFPSSLALSIQNKRWFTARGDLLNGQNLFSLTKVIWWSPKVKIAQKLFKIKNEEFQTTTWSDYKLHKQLVFFCCLCCFPIQQWPCHNSIITERGLNIFDNCAAEYVGRRVYLFFLRTK